MRIRITDGEGQVEVVRVSGPVVTIGRSPDNAVCLKDREISMHHGRLKLTADGCEYEDLESTNGSVVARGKKSLPLNRDGTHTCALRPGDVIRIASFALELETPEPGHAPGAIPDDVTVVLSRPTLRTHEIPAGLEQADPQVAEKFSEFVRASAHVLSDQSQLLSVTAAHLLEAFSQATNLLVVLQDVDSGSLSPVLSRTREGEMPYPGLSRTIVERVLDEEIAILFSQIQDSLGEVESVVRSGIETAIAAPLCGMAGAFGVVQLDVRFPTKGVFTRNDLDALVLFAGHLGSVLENQRLYQEQRRALNSTINALVHSLSLKDPSAALHSERVQSVALFIGKEMGLSEEDLEVLSVASILHDMGKHAVRDDILFKSGKLSPSEYEEISEHATRTQNILDKIFYPAHLRSVPLIAAYHHERIDGAGTFGIRGDEIPLLSRIIAVSDAFDALTSSRVYKDPKPLEEAISVLRKGQGTHWDEEIVDVVARTADEILSLAKEADLRQQDRGDDLLVQDGNGGETESGRSRRPDVTDSPSRQARWRG